jgi:D-proline reductase (dithiol) PrdB
VGLIQNAIESGGISTISLTMHPHITKMVGAPRAIYMRYPQGNLFGEPFNAAQQRSILRSALEAVSHIEQPGTILEYPGRWRARRTMEG